MNSMYQQATISVRVGVRMAVFNVMYVL